MCVRASSLPSPGLVGINRCTKVGSNEQTGLYSVPLKVRTDRAIAGIIYKRNHQNSIYIIRSHGMFKIRGLSLKCQIIAKDISTPNNQIPL